MTTTTTTPPQNDSVQSMPSDSMATTPLPVSLTGILVLMTYLVALSILLVYGLLAFWPPSDLDSTTSSITFLEWDFAIQNEVRLLTVVALAGAMGSQIHALRSFFWYVGNRNLKWSWIPMYLMLPFTGAILGIIFYLVIRAGFFAPGTNAEQASPWGVTATAALVGMFSQQAVLKLKEVADTLFSKPPGGADSTPQQQTDSSGSDATSPGNSQTPTSGQSEPGTARPQAQG
jgi:hypothetical protein